MESFLNLFEESIEIKGGYSHDRLFKCRNEDNQYYLCRFFKINKMAQASEHYNLLRQFQGVKGIQQIHYILKCNDKEHGVLVFDWVEGKPLNEVLDERDNQFELGQQAAHLLNLIHSTKIEHTNLSKESYKRIEKLQYQIEEYLALGGDFEGIDKLIDLYNENKDKYQLTPMVQCHGDFHASNIIINDKNELTLIDFDRQKVWGRDDDIEPLIFFDSIEFIKGVLSIIELSQQEKQNIITMLSMSMRSITWAISNEYYDSLEYLIHQNQQIVEKLKQLDFIS